MEFNDVLTKIKEGFPQKAWVYLVSQHQVQIGIWDGDKMNLKDGYSPEYLLELRVFTNNREIRVVQAHEDFLLRDSEDFDVQKAIEDKYIMYGEKIDGEKQESYQDGYSALKEDRGGVLWFPGRIADNFKNLKLGIRNFYCYHPVPVLPNGNSYDAEMGEIGKGSLEFFDYAFTGFFYANDKEVELI
ncbi:CRISPR-associated protein Csx19 [Acetobacterium wieringae]|uniref:CRISPR-associated protein Csx19 n=1 Tax=Acetobacterium wieringae TaxID=52694 RepID=A0ABY6HAU7_9FIRM|nr:CRISPR-associated protein Csx19 [Acetobacterium wieringae]UYO61634.1 CRISPR-associated protein Csx19 [Acetobacterium wieringae]